MPLIEELEGAVPLVRRGPEAVDERDRRAVAAADGIAEEVPAPAPVPARLRDSTELATCFRMKAVYFGGKLPRLHAHHLQGQGLGPARAPEGEVPRVVACGVACERDAAFPISTG
jgi:hypothetical protein